MLKTGSKMKMSEVKAKNRWKKGLTPNTDSFSNLWVVMFVLEVVILYFSCLCLCL